MVAMSMSHFPGKRFIAILLSVGFLLAFVACISICAKESEDHTSSLALSSIETNDGSDCDNCPLPQTLKSTAPERSTDIRESQTAVSLLPFTSSVELVAGGISLDLPRRRPSFSALPASSLTPLRI
jgi:hypothetical protein